MFNLEQAIAEWRRKMLAADIKTPAPLNELELHLREEIERQVKSGITAQAAFQVAVESIGPVGQLKVEFKKVDGLDKITLQKKAGHLYAGMLVFYSAIMTYTIFAHDLTLGERLLGLASLVTLLAGFYIAWQVTPRFFPIIPGGLAQSAVGLGGGISGAIWLVVFARLLLPRFDFTGGQLAVSVMWAMVPALLLPGTAFRLLDISEHQPPSATVS